MPLTSYDVARTVVHLFVFPYTHIRYFWTRETCVRACSLVKCSHGSKQKIIHTYCYRQTATVQFRESIIIMREVYFSQSIDSTDCGACRCIIVIIHKLIRTQLRTHHNYLNGYASENWEQKNNYDCKLTHKLRTLHHIPAGHTHPLLPTLHKHAHLSHNHLLLCQLWWPLTCGRTVTRSWPQELHATG
jgi:hypothetical protein